MPYVFNPFLGGLDYDSSIATPVAVASGGTGLSSYVVGDLLYASGATTLSKLADAATGNALISGGVATAPSWGKIVLGTHTSGAYVAAEVDTLSTVTARGATTGVTITPTANDGAALGISGTAWSDLFLASGAVLNFNAGNLTITHSAGVMTSTGAWSIATSLTTPLLIGGTTTTSPLKLRTTSANGLTGADIIFQGGNATEELGRFDITATAAVAEDISYTNSGGSGARTALISITNTISFNAGVNALIDGSQANSIWFGGEDVTNKYIQFDFLNVGAATVVTEATWYQSGAQAEGTWKWQGSQNASSWTDIGGNFTFSAATEVMTTLSGNTTAYRYYRMLGISGTTSSGPYQREVEFKIGTAAIAATFSSRLGVNTATPTGTIEAKSWGTTTGTVFRLLDSADTVLMSVLDSGVTTVKGNFSPITSDAASLGTTDLPFSDVFLASAGEIQWASNNAAIVHQTSQINIEIVNSSRVGIANGVTVLQQHTRQDTGYEFTFGGYYTCIMWQNVTAVNNWVFATAVGADTLGSGNIIFCEYADRAANFSHANVPDPHIFIHSSDATTITDYLEFFHDQTNANIRVGGGDLLTNVVTGSGFTWSVNDVAVATLDATSGLKLSERIQGKQGADVASAAAITLGTDGNAFEITGTMTIDHIVVTNWQEGAEVTLIFN